LAQVADNLPTDMSRFTASDRWPGQVYLEITGMYSLKYGALERLLVVLAGQARNRGASLVVQHNGFPRSEQYRHDLLQAGGRIEVLDLRKSVRGCVRAVRLLIRFRPVVVNMHFVDLPIRAVLLVAARALGVSKVLSMVRSQPSSSHPWAWRLVLGMMDHVLCVSDSVKNDLLVLGVSERVLATVRNGILAVTIGSGDREETRRELGIGDGATVLMCTAFDDVVKGVDVLLEAFSKYLTPKFEDFHLVLVGLDQQGETARNAPPRVHFAGITDEVARYLAAADIYAQPSRSEGLPSAALEAMSAGLPVVASKVGGIPEAVEDGVTGILVEAARPEQLATAISILAEDEELRRRMGQEGQARFNERFRMDPALTRLLRYYA